MFDSLYSIVSERDNGFLVALNKDDIVFKVHFEGSPVLPGACMVEMAREVIERRMNRKLKIDTIKSIRFAQLVVPTETERIFIELDLTEESEGIAAKVQVTDESGTTVFAKISMILTQK